MNDESKTASSGAGPGHNVHVEGGDHVREFTSAAETPYTKITTTEAQSRGFVHEHDTHLRMDSDNVPRYYNTARNIYWDAMTAKQSIDAAIHHIEDLEARGSRTSADRELSMAITHLEDAKIRVNRGFAKWGGFFNEVDLETPVGQDRAIENHANNVQGNPPDDVTRSKGPDSFTVQREHPGYGRPLVGKEVPADGTTHTLEVPGDHEPFEAGPPQT